MLFFLVVVTTVIAIGGGAGAGVAVLVVPVVVAVVVVVWAAYFLQNVFDIPVWSLLLLCSTDLADCFFT